MITDRNTGTPPDWTARSGTPAFPQTALYHYSEGPLPEGNGHFLLYCQIHRKHPSTAAHLLPSVRHMRTLQEGRIVPSIRSISQKRTVFPSFSASFLSLSVTVHAYVPSNGICRGFALNTANSCCHHVFLRHFRFQKCLPMNSNQKSIKMSIRFFPTLAFTASGNFPC